MHISHFRNKSTNIFRLAAAVYRHRDTCFCHQWLFPVACSGRVLRYRCLSLLSFVACIIKVDNLSSELVAQVNLWKTAKKEKPDENKALCSATSVSEKVRFRRLIRHQSLVNDQLFLICSLGTWPPFVSETRKSDRKVLESVCFTSVLMFRLSTPV